MDVAESGLGFMAAAHNCDEKMQQSNQKSGEAND